MYTLFLDESGDDFYLKKDGSVNQDCSKNITVGGIIVKDSDIEEFNNKYYNLIRRYFYEIELEDDFKLHYTKLKRGFKSPYKEIHFEGRAQLSRDVFSIIKNTNCSFLACNINKPNHWARYDEQTRNPKAYSLLVCVENFINFLQMHNEEGIIIYEEFEHIRKQMGDEMKELLSYPNFPNIHNLHDVEKLVRSGNPQQHPTLQFSDFVIHSIWLHKERPDQIVNRFFDLTDKMYKFRVI